MSIVIVLIPISTFAQGGSSTWIKAIGGGDQDVGVAVEQTPDGGYIVVGHSRSFDAHNAFLAKFDSEGKFEWAKVISNTRQGLDVDRGPSGNYFIAGETLDNKIFLLKLDSAFNVQWAKAIGGADIGIFSSLTVQGTSDGGCIVAATTRGIAANNRDIFLLKFGSGGNLVWAKAIGGSNSDYGRFVQTTSDGGYIVAGLSQSFGGGRSLLLKFNSGGVFQWGRNFGGGWDPPYSVQQTSDGGYIVAGRAVNLNGAYLFKFDSSGNLIWSKTSGAVDDEGTVVQQTSDGGYILTGCNHNTPRVFLRKFNSLGSLQWAKEISGGGCGFFIQQTSDGGYVVTGMTSGYGAGNNDIFFIKTDSNGNINDCDCPPLCDPIPPVTVRDVSPTNVPISPSVTDITASVPITALSPTLTDISPIITSVCPAPAFFDCGLRAYDGTNIIKIACEPPGTLTSPLRIRGTSPTGSGSATYGIVLVEITDPSASKIRIRTASGIKALRKL